MRFLSLLIFVLLIWSTSDAQSLRDINYRYLYNAAEPFTFQLKPVKSGESWSVHYQLMLRDSSASPSEYSVRWEIRRDLGDKDGAVLSVDSTKQIRNRHGFYGSVTVPAQHDKIFIAARVRQVNGKKAWYFYQRLINEYPVNSMLMTNQKPVLDTYVKLHREISNEVATQQSSIVTLYKQPFPAGTPPFSESQARVAPALKADSIFTWPAGSPINFSTKGLYLVQQDTTSSNGIAFRVEDDYPRLGKVESLADPLIYICTRDEFLRVKMAKGDKKAFDKVILSITGDAERAKVLFRSYFRRVEQANEFFSSYKEGWKTDRGMIFIVFGLPQEVYRFEDREVWKYNNDDVNLELTFSRSSTLFDPDNYVLLRARRYQETWYSVIDLWRSARF